MKYVGCAAAPGTAGCRDQALDGKEEDEGQEGDERTGNAT